MGSTSATLNGDLVDTDCAESVDVWFEWGQKGDGLANATARQTTDSEGPFSEDLTFEDDGLGPETTYEFRALSDNGVAVGTGSIQQFTTDDVGTCEPCI